MMSVCCIRWNAKKAPICNLSDTYAAWVYLCSKKRKSLSYDDNWERLFRWLKKPETYLKVKFLADFVDLFKRRGLLEENDKDS